MNYEALRKLNTMTKYPSIPTWNKMGKHKRLTDDKFISEPWPWGKWQLTEKIDGVNARIIYADGRVYIGSRDELLHCVGDRLCWPPYEIITAMENVAVRLEAYLESLAKVCRSDSPHDVFVLYAEVYGGKLPNAEHYTAKQNLNYALFDVMMIRADDYHRLLHLELERIAAWRDHGEQPFLQDDRLSSAAQALQVPMVPHLAVTSDMPVTINEALGMLQHYCSTTKAGMDFHGHAEGIVARRMDGDRCLVKLRLEDYGRTAKLGVWEEPIPNG